MEKIRRDPVVFFVIEGCLKADAVLSAGGAVFSVPSVSLWNAPELPHFADKYLRGKAVIIVPDADWFKNSHVITQARFAQAFLCDHGVEAHVAAPPLMDGKVVHKGVDDYLGEGRGKLKYLEVIERTIPTGRILNHAVNLPTARSVDALRRLVETVNTVSQFADSQGNLSATYATLGRLMCGKGVLERKAAEAAAKRASRGIKDAMRAGLVEMIEGDLETKRKWVPNKGGGGHWSNCDEWVEPPTFKVVEELRATDDHKPLGQLFPVICYLEAA